MFEFSEVLRTSRRKAGLSQADAAHLLDVSVSHISRLEAGEAVPGVGDLAGVALVFGRPMEGMTQSLFIERSKVLRERLLDLPETKGHRLAQFNRRNTLNALEARVARILEHYDG